MRLALFAALLLAGCTSTRYVDATSPAAIDAASAAVVGRDAEIALVSGDRYRGRVQFLRPDSTAWANPSAYYVVPTSDVRSFIIDRRRQSLGRGALIGGGSAFALCFVAGTSLSDGFGGDGGENVSVGLLLGAACTPGGVLYGILGGAIAGGDDHIVLFDPEAQPAGEAAAGPSQ